MSNMSTIFFSFPSLGLQELWDQVSIPDQKKVDKVIESRASEHDPDACRVCKRKGIALKKCGKCKQRLYCSRECQVKGKVFVICGVAEFYLFLKLSNLSICEPSFFSICGISSFTLSFFCFLNRIV